MFLKNASILHGQELKLISSTNIRISNQIFRKIDSNLKPMKNEAILDCNGLLIIPGFINAHTHIGDSIAKDFSLESSANSRIHPIIGKKGKILKNSKPEHLANFMRNSCKSMIKKGITTFVDFREGELEGIIQLKNAITDLPIRPVILGRIEYYLDKKQIKNNAPLPSQSKKKLLSLLKHCDGIGISGPNENSDSILKWYSKTKKIKAIHSAETIESSKTSKKITNLSESQRALLLDPHFLIHMTFASKQDLKKVGKKTRGIVVCPRANATLAEGIPNVECMIKNGCTIALGTDNVMINSPDMFREMDYLWKVTMGINKQRFSAKDILKMATVNGGKILGKKIGIIKENYLADCMFIEKHSIDLEPIHNVHASVVHRASESSIRAVMIGGKIIHGGI